MRCLQLQCKHKPVEPFEDAALVGEVPVEQGEGRSHHGSRTLDPRRCGSGGTGRLDVFHGGANATRSRSSTAEALGSLAIA